MDTSAIDNGEAVYGQKLDDLFQTYFVPRIVKMDIEGANILF